MANKSCLVLCILFHTFSMSTSMDWMLSRPSQCPGKVPRSQALIWTTAAISTVECVKKCEENYLCVAVYYNGECQMYSSVADKECTGFVEEAGSVKSNYFEVQKKCSGSTCRCTESYRGKYCNLHIVDAASHLPMDEIKENKLVGFGLIPIFGDKLTFEPGKDGKAIRIQYPTYLDYGDQRRRCFGNFDKCSNGWAAVMWMYNFDGSRLGGYFLSSGGQTGKAGTGMALWYYSDADGQYIRCVLKTSSKKWSGSVKMSVKTWYHIAITWNADKGLAIYLDGNLATEQTTGTDVTPTDDTFTKFTIGVPNNIESVSVSDQANYYPNGHIDDLIVWEKSLSAEFIEDLYATPNYKHA